MREDKVTPSSLSISALINNPNAPASAIRPGLRDIPPVTLSPVPPVSGADFQDYVQQIAREYGDFLQAKEAGLKQHLALENRAGRRTRTSSLATGTELLEANVAYQLPRSVAIDSSRTSLDERMSTLSGSPGSEKSGFSLDEQPAFSNVFFDSDFELKNPRTFDLVCGNAQIKVLHEGKATRISLSGASRLQDRLSLATDAVEADLVDEIAATGPAIFEAIQNLGSLAEQTARCTEHLEDLRTEFQGLGTDNADAAIQLAKLKTERRNVRTLRQATQALSKLSQCYAVAMSGSNLLSSTLTNMAEFDACCKANQMLSQTAVVQSMQSALANERQVVSGRFARTGAEELLAVLNDTIQSRELKTLENELSRRHLPRFQGMRAEAQPSGTTSSASKLKQTLQGLHELSLLEPTFAIYREALSKEIKAVTKRQLPSGDETESLTSSRTAMRSAADKSASLARGLRAMTAIEFNNMLGAIFFETSRFLRGVMEQQKSLIDFVASAEMDPAMQGRLFMQDLVSTLADTAQRRIVKVLQVRAPQIIRLETLEFVRYYELNYVFVAECETSSASSRTGHSEMLQAQTRDWFTEASRLQVTALISALESDTWQPVNVSESAQAVVDLLQENFPHSKAQWLQMEWPSSETDKIVKSIKLQEERYMVPASTEALLLAICWHVRLLLHIPILRNEALHNMAALVRLYHDQTWLLILGAGATKTAGLERITAKHLAIASQAIALVGTLVPQFSQLAESVLAGTAAPVRSFKELEQVYANHREELLEKLIAIMNDRTRALAHQLSQLDLEAEPSPGQANSYMVTLVKDTTILFKVLSKFLNGASLQRIMSDVVAFAEAHLAEIFASKTSAGSVKAEQAIKADRAYYLSKIGALPGILALLQPPLGSKLGPLEASVQTPGEEVSMTFDEISPMKANEIAAVDAVATAEATKETKVEQGPA